MAARFSSGDNNTWPYSGPPTYSTKFPSSSLNAVRTSSSSSTDSSASVRYVGQLPSPLTIPRHTVQEWDQFVPCPLRAKSQRDCGQSMDGIQSQEDIVVLHRVSELASATRGFMNTDLELVNQHGNGIKLIILIRLHVSLPVDTGDRRESICGNKGEMRKIGPG